MNGPLAALAELVRVELGSDLPEGRFGLLREAAERRAQSVGSPDFASYVASLAAGELHGEWEVLASLLTIKESSFFRVPQQWERIRGEILPALLRTRATSRRLRFWSAACAAGEEPGTLALLLGEEPSLAGWDWSILATDLDAEALSQAGRGLYGERAIAAVPAALCRSGFTRRGRLWELDPQLRSHIVYRRMNLARPPYRIPAPFSEASFDLVLLRNVLIYFRAELQRAVVAEVTRHLAADGWLFLGGSETLWRVQEKLVAVDLGDCFGYRQPRAGESSAASAPSSKHAPVAVRASPPDAAAPVGESRCTPAAPGSTPGERLLAALAHLEADRLREAEGETAAALEADPSDPAAHALAGLLHDLAGRNEKAVEALRAALYLEPELVQVRLLLAGCLRRLGAAAHAERQYREIVTTLERGGGRRLALLDGRFLADTAETLRRARAALANLRPA